MFSPDLSLVPRQSVAWELINRSDVGELMYGGAKGGGKSVFGCYWSFLIAYGIACEFFPDVPDFPVAVGFMGRKVGRDFRDTTLGTWKRFIPADMYKVKGKPEELIIGDRVKILTGGLDRSEDIQKFNSAELAFAFIDQAEETTKDDVSALRASLRLTVGGRELPYKILFTANPRQCWLKDEFITNPAPHRRFVQALPGDNPLLPKSYIDNLKDAFSYRPELLEAYLHGSWDALEGADQIIKSLWLTEAEGRTIVGLPRRPRLVVDTARFGDDETVIYYMEESDVLEQWVKPHCRSVDISSRLAALSLLHSNCPVVVEATGGDIGAAVVDELVALKVKVVVFRPQGKAIDSERYYNLRAEAWDSAAKKLARGEIEFSCRCMSQNDRSQLRNQLTSPTYKFVNSRTLVESKADIKKRLGRSPDRGDTWVIGQWSYDKVPSIEMDIPQDSLEEDMDLAESYAVNTVI